MFVHWDRPRRWAVRLYKPYANRVGGYHSTIGVIALSVDRAIEAAQAQEPESRIESVNDTGAVDIVVDAPMGPNVEFSGGAPLHGAASAGTQGSSSTKLYEY